jgi:hypothetical protein
MDFMHLLPAGLVSFCVCNSHFDIGSLFLRLCSPNANIFIHNNYWPSLTDSLSLIGSIDGDDVSSGAPMSQKVLGFSQQRMIPTTTRENVIKIMVLFDQAVETSLASQTMSVGQNYFAACFL